MEWSVNEYSKRFDVDAYLATRYGCPGSQTGENLMRDFALEKLRDYFQEMAAINGSTSCGELKVLDYGCGPVIANVISAASLASEIVLAEYTERGRTAVQRWLDRDPSSFNWSPYFRFVVHTLEGKSVQAAEEREEHVRRVVKAVVRCDVARDASIENGYEGPYEIVICSLCLCTACKTKVEFSKSVGRIGNLIKRGGVLLLYTPECEDRDDLAYCSYYIGNDLYCAFPLSQPFLLATLKERGFDEIDFKRLQADQAIRDMGFIGCLFITAYKK